VSISVPDISRPLSTSVISGWAAGFFVSFPLSSQCTSLTEALFELVTDDVARLVVRVLVVTGVLVLTYVR